MLLFTRPLPKLKASASAFEKAGIDAVGIATSNIIDISSERKAAAEFLASNAVNAIVVTSVYAVDTVIEGLRETANELPLIIAVGDATARKLQAGLQEFSSAQVAIPEAHTSEGILAMHQLNEANCQHVVIIKGEGGRDAIATGLDEKGILVNSFCVYKREQLTSPIYTKRWKMGEVSGIIATSEAMALQLIAQFGQALKSIKWLTVSDRIAKNLTSQGIKEVAVCQRATDQALIAWVKDNWEYGMANNNESSPQKEELVKVEAEKDVIESSATHSESTSSGAAKKKSSGNGLLWFVVIILFLIVLGMAGAGYWYYMQQQSASKDSESALQTTTSQLNTIERERAGLVASIDKVARTNQTLESTVAELKAQNEKLTLQAESTLEQLNNMEGRRPADWLIAEADYLVRMAGRKLWLENDVRTAILLLVNADKRLKSLADPSVLPVRANLAEDIQTLQQLNPVSQSSVALALTGMIAQIDKLPLDTFEKPEDANAEDTTLSESADDWQENLAKVWRSLVNDFLTVKTIEGPVEPVLSLEAQFLAKEQLRLQLMHAQTAALQGDAGLYSQSLQYAQTIIIEKFDTEKSQVTGFVDALQNLIATDVSRPIPTELASQKPLERLLDSRVKQVFGQGASALGNG